MSVVLEEVVKEFEGGARAVDGISLEIAAGEMVTLLGPSGCGKTTTLRMIAGFEEPTSGSILIGGRDMTRVPAHARDTPMVFQSYALFPHLSVRENATFGLTTRGVEKARARARVAELAETMGLSELLDRSPHQLSGGQQQRVALLRAMVTEPKVLLFDEPLSNLDARLRVGMRAEIRRVQKRSGITAVYVTHDQEEAMVLSDRIVVMERGRIAQVGTPREVYAKPASRFVASFLGEASFVEGTAGAGAVECALGRVPVAGGAEGRVTLVLRPEAVRLSRAGEDARGVIRSATYLGAQTMYEIEVAGGVMVQSRSTEAFEEGERVAIAIDDAAVHVLEA